MVNLSSAWASALFFCFSKSCHARGQKVDWATWLCSLNELGKGGRKGGFKPDGRALGKQRSTDSGDRRAPNRRSKTERFLPFSSRL